MFGLFVYWKNQQNIEFWVFLSFKCLPTYYLEKKVTQNSQENIPASY